MFSEVVVFVALVMRFTSSRDAGSRDLIRRRGIQQRRNYRSSPPREIPGEMASLICAAVAAGNSDHNSAIAPVTKGAATLVPPSVSGCPSALKLVMASPGAR